MDKMFALDQKVDQNAARPRIRKHKMSDLKPLPPDDLAELEKEAWAEFEAQLDDYISQYKAALEKFLEEKGNKRKGGGKPKYKLKKGTP